MKKVTMFWAFILSFFQTKSFKTHNQRRGALAEKAAKKHLKVKGYHLLKANWRSGLSEIDLVMKDGGVIVFVEVRGRVQGALVSGFNSITHRKKQALREAQRVYFTSLKQKPVSYRWDVVEVEFGLSTSRDEILNLWHYENVKL